MDLYTVNYGGNVGTYTESDIDRLIEQGVFTAKCDFRITSQSKGYTLAICKGLNGRLLLELSLNTKECISATDVLTMVFKWFRAIRRQGFKTLSYDYIRVIDTDGYLRLYNENTLNIVYERLRDCKNNQGMYVVVGKQPSLFGVSEYPSLATMITGDGKINLSATSTAAMSDSTIKVVEEMVKCYLENC